MEIKQKLWIRKLYCGHERTTDINFTMKIYTKPKVNDLCYCRECCKEVKVVKVEEAIKEETEELKKLIKEKIKNGK